MMLYVFSVVLAKLVSKEQGPHSSQDDLLYWFGSVPRTALTLLECLIGGAEWDRPMELLKDEVGMPAGLLFTSYIFGGLFMMLNVVTGIFVDKAMLANREETDLHMANEISKAFS